MLFSVQKEKKNISHIIPLVLLVTILICFVIFADKMSDSNQKRGKDILENALTRSITQCYALEGMYPSSLDYLIDNYGLTYDADRYYIDYRFIGSNLRPDITIIEKE